MLALMLTMCFALMQQPEIRPQQPGQPAQPAAPADAKPSLPVVQPLQQNDSAASPAEAAPAYGSSGRNADAQQPAAAAAPKAMPAGLERWKGKVALVTGKAMINTLKRHY